MKKTLSIITITAIMLGLSHGALAAEPKAKASTAQAVEASKKAVESAAEKVVGEPKTIPMYSRVDAIDVPGKTLTTTRKDGASVKHILTDSTPIMNAGAPAKLADIKVGDYVSGSRKKINDTEYTVVKITKFGAKEAKKEGSVTSPETAKPAGKKAE